MVAYVPDDYAVCNYRYPIYYIFIFIFLFLIIMYKRFSLCLLFAILYLSLIIYVDNSNNYMVVNNTLYKKYYTVYECFNFNNTYNNCHYNDI